MTEMTPEARYVLEQLQEEKTPEVMFLVLHHQLLDIWNDTLEYVNSQEDHTAAHNRLSVLMILYGEFWYRQQGQKIQNAINADNNFFVVTRAPASVFEWETNQFEDLQQDTKVIPLPVAYDYTN